MIMLNKLSEKEKVYLTELANTVCRPPISVETLGSIKYGVLQFALNNKGLPPRKFKVIERILAKIPMPGQLVDGELVEKAEQLELF